MGGILTRKRVKKYIRKGVRKLPKVCSNCYFGECCTGSRACRYYAPMEEDESEVIEEGRNQFQSEWFSYIYQEEFDNDDFVYKTEPL